ncbi:MAG: hypothetical protein ACRDTD_21145 [Pseudonocardiaceae bacterium]
MSYTLDIDPAARAQIQALPSAGVDALAEAMAVLSLVPERGEPINAANPDGGVYQLTFGGGRGLITYLLLTDRNRVDVLIVTWVDFS